ncbi:hypothetical protein PG999_007635 [Apiospora kogelbergensis]|uniref:2EXR domain-containing protein n=1 Tax=Apiospora kogelbergensis TaxID=1337665 RepID=A0AAW0QNC4_9PEZI
MSTPCTQLQGFSSLPPELRVSIWGWFLEMEKKDRKVMGCFCAVGPTRSLISPLLMANRESRAEVLQRYPNALAVYRNYTAECQISYRSWRRRSVRAGVIHVNWYADTMWVTFGFASGIHRNLLSPALQLWVNQKAPYSYRYMTDIYFIPVGGSTAQIRENFRRPRMISLDQVEEIYPAIGALFD